MVYEVNRLFMFGMSDDGRQLSLGTINLSSLGL